MLTIITASLAGCQMPGHSSAGYAASSVGSRWQEIQNALFHPVTGRVGESERDFASRMIPADSRTHRPTARVAGPSAQLAVYQEMTPPLPYQATEEIERYRGQPQRSIAPQRSVQPQPRNRLSQPGHELHDTVGPRFYADELARSLPQTATERVIELTSEMAVMRQELQRLGQAVEQLKSENNELREMRNQQDHRLSSLEAELETSRHNEEAAKAQFEMLGQRIQLFNARRQQQIAELNAIIDQLESHLRRAEPGNHTLSNTNPYRASTGDRHAFQNPLPGR